MAPTTNAESALPRDLPSWLWLWGVFAILVLERAFAQSGDRVYFWVIQSELGLVENLTFFYLITAVVAVFLVYPLLGSLPIRRFRFFFVLFALGCFYFAGEELSWGQQWFGWATPEGWTSLNTQHETNLHNLGSEYYGGLFDQVPRTLLTTGAFVGGVLVPLFVFWRKVRLDPRVSWLYWALPTRVCLPAGLLAASITLPRKIFKAMGTSLPETLGASTGEMKEYFLAYFLMVYALSILVRARQMAPAKAGVAADAAAQANAATVRG